MDTVIINDQEWAAENLTTKVFRNGDIIMEAQSYDEWEHAAENKIPAWCYYKKNDKNEAVYGILYNWYAVNDPRGLAPDGWKVPSIEDWEKLAAFLGDYHAYRLRSNDMWMADDEMANFFSSIRKNINKEDNDTSDDELEEDFTEEVETRFTDEEIQDLVQKFDDELEEDLYEVKTNDLVQKLGDEEDDKSNENAGKTFSDEELSKIIDSIFGDDEESKLKESNMANSNSAPILTEKKADEIENESNYDGDLTYDDEDEEEDDFIIDDSILNSTNFNAQPGGARGRFGNAFFALGDSAYWWTSTEDDPDEAYFILLYYHNDDLQIGGSTDKKVGHSVRCIKEK